MQQSHSAVPSVERRFDCRITFKQTAGHWGWRRWRFSTCFEVRYFVNYGHRPGLGTGFSGFDATQMGALDAFDGLIDNPPGDASRSWHAPWPTYPENRRPKPSAQRCCSAWSSAPASWPDAWPGATLAPTPGPTHWGGVAACTSSSRYSAP